ncbi:MAG: RagB/SusD family nutrient uptake outer membrane protein [Bacteroidales bacterium]|nr:RagB/SusD family nutrient uptake outer membrane protein [Bacteroidales bacterium]
MKKLYKILIAAFSALVILPSCAQLLEPEPYGLVDLDLVWTKYNYTSSLVNTIGNCSEYRSTLDYAPLGDEAQHVNDRTGGLYYSWYNVDFLNGNYPMSSGYDSYYNNLRTIAFYLTNNYKISFTNVDKLELEYWEVKAHLFRAWHYFMLMKRFGQAVIFTECYNPNETFENVKLSNVEQIADFIIEELDWCLGATENESSPYTYRWKPGSYSINRGWAWVLKARTAMFAASPLYYQEGSKYTWEYAYQINKEAVEQLRAHGYKLFDEKPKNNYALNCYDYYHIYPSDPARNVDNETIFGNGGSLKMWQSYALPINKGRSSCGICPTQELVDCYETIDGEPILDLEKPYLDEEHLQPNYNKNNKMYDPENPYENRDPRFYGSIFYNNAPRYWNSPNGLRVQTYVGGNCGISDDANSLYYTRTGYYIRKFACDRSSDENGTFDGRVHNARLAEMYLNLAECACEAGHLDVANDYTNLVRERVGMPALPDGLTQDQLRLRIRNERRVELAFENIRWDDVRRWKIIDQTEEHVTGMRITKDNATGKFNYTRFSLGTRTNKGHYKYLLYPMSELEVQKMLYLTGDNWQTPGWE